jgi:hypothetical protein
VFVAEKPRLWSEARYQTRGLNRMFDMDPNGKRFALAPLEETPSGANDDHLTFVVNFFNGLQRIARRSR